MNATDATTLQTLEIQWGELSAVLDIVEWARGALVPAKATFWEGQARESYDRAVVAVAHRLDSTRDLLVLARQNTQLAIGEVAARG
jgi:hypothetical protein